MAKIAFAFKHKSDFYDVIMSPNKNHKIWFPVQKCKENWNLAQNCLKKNKTKQKYFSWNILVNVKEKTNFT